MQGLLTSYLDQPAARARARLRASPQARSCRLSGLDGFPWSRAGHFPVAFLFVGVSAVSLWRCCSCCFFCCCCFCSLGSCRCCCCCCCCPPGAPAAPPAAPAAPPVLLLPPLLLLLLLLLLPPPRLLLLPPPLEGVRACPAVCTVAVPILQVMRAGRAPQGLEGAHGVQDG